jgi:hypothetical protein
MHTSWKKSIKRYALGGFVLVISGTVLVQCAGIPKIPGLDDILKKEPPITTSISDAVTEIPFLDDFDPKVLSPLLLQPRDPDGTFQVATGLFEFTAMSYCLGAGKYAPRGGAGYLYAPLKGPQADIVSNILQRSVVHPEIPQRDIQVLLWAIMARTKISDMSREMQQTAAKLLTAEELFRINGGALGLIPEELLDKAFAKLPPQVGQVLEAEARLRRKLTEAKATYEELERIAVLSGDPPPQEGDREVPRGRWSYHPDGYFIRYFPSGYSQTLVHIYVPECFQIERDELGRIVLIADEKGNGIETDYDDTIEPLAISGDPDLRGYAFRSVRFISPDPSKSGERRLAEWRDVGWTLVNIPSGEGDFGQPSGRFSDLKERYEWAKTHKKQVERLDEHFDPQGDINGIMDLGHYTLALKKAISGGHSDNIAWASDHIDVVTKAWQSAVCKREGGCEELDKPIRPGGAASPGDTGRQILAQSGNHVPLPKPDWMSQDVWDQLDDCKKRCVWECEKYRESAPDLWEKCIDDCYEKCNPPIA